MNRSLAAARGNFTRACYTLPLPNYQLTPFNCVAAKQLGGPRIERFDGGGECCSARGERLQTCGVIVWAFAIRMGGNGNLKAKIRVWRLDPERDGALARAGATRTAFSVYRGDGDLDEHIARLAWTRITKMWVELCRVHYIMKS